MTDNIKNLYNAISDKYDLGTEAQFRASLKDANNRKNLYDAISDKYDLGTIDDFNKSLGYGSVQAQQASAPSGDGILRKISGAMNSGLQKVQQAKPQQKPTQPKPAATPMQPVAATDGFGELNIRQANQMGMGKGAVSWNEKPGRISPQTGKPVPQDNTNTVKDIDKAIKGNKEAAKRSGLDTSVQRMQEEREYYEATGKPLANIVNTPVSAPTAVKDKDGNMLMGQTTDEQRVSQYQQQERDVIRRQLNEQVINPTVKSAIIGLDEKLTGEGSKALLAALEGKSMGAFDKGMITPEEYDAYRIASPESLLDALNKTYGANLDKQGNISGPATDFANNIVEQNRDLIERSAARLGMPVEDFVWQEFIPQVSEQLAEGFHDRMEDKYSVKDTADYLTRKMSNSVIGTLATMGTSSKMERQLRGEELFKTEEGEGKYYNAGVGARMTGSIAMFAPDAPVLTVSGVAGEFGTKAVGRAIELMGKKELGRLVAQSSPFLAANVSKTLKYGGIYANSMLRGAGSMGSFMGTSSAVQELSTGDGTFASIGRAFLEGAWSGAKFGFATGAFGVASHTIGGKIGKAGQRNIGKKAAFYGGAFLVENQIFTGLDYLEDPDNFNWVDSAADAFYMQIGSKFSSGHGIKGVAQEFKDMFSVKPKENSKVQLSDVDKESIQKAFAGMDFLDIASDVENVGKILSDKQNIPWVTRMKVSVQVQNTCESARPRTSDININAKDKTISERAADGELIEVHKYNDVDELMQVRQSIEERRANDDMLADFNKLMMVHDLEPSQSEIDAVANELLASNSDLRPEDVQPGGKSYDFVLDESRSRSNVAMQVITQFAQDYGMNVEDVRKIMEKKPIERLDDEPDLMADLAKRLHDAAYPAGEKHTEQSHIDGETLAGNGGAVDPDTSAQVAKEYDEARNAYLQFLAGSETMRDAVNQLGNGARLDDIYLHIRENYSGAEVDEFLKVLADYANATAKREGFIDKAGKNIEEEVNQDIDKNSFHGTLDDAPNDNDIITIEHEGRRLTLLNGNIGTRMTQGGAMFVDPDKSGGMIIAIDENGQWVKLTPDANIAIVEFMPKGAYADNLREELGVTNTSTLVETGLVKPQEEQPQPVPETEKPGTNEVERAPETSSEEPVEKAPVVESHPSQIPVDEKTGVKMYEQGVDIDTAINDIKNDGRDVNSWADLAIAEAQDALGKIKEPKTRADLIKNEERVKELQQVIDYYTQLKNRNNELESLKNPAKENNEPKNNVTLQAKPATSPIRGTVEEQKQERIKALKAELGELFDDDFTKANDVYELASMWLSRDRKLSRDSVGQELGWNMGVGKDARYIETMLAKKGEGMTINEFVHGVWESPENTVDGEKRYTTEEIREAVLDLLQSATSKSDVVDYAVNTRERAARASLEEERLREEEANAIAGEKSDALSSDDMERASGELPFAPPVDGEDIPNIPDTPIGDRDVQTPNLKDTVKEVENEIKVRHTRIISSDEDMRVLAEAGVGEEILKSIEKDRADVEVLARYIPELGEVLLFEDHFRELGLSKEQQKAFIYHENIHGLEREGVTKEQFAEIANIIESVDKEFADNIRRLHADKSKEVQDEEILAYLVHSIVEQGFEKDMLEGTLDAGSGELNEKLYEIGQLLQHGRKEKEVSLANTGRSGDHGESRVEQAPEEGRPSEPRGVEGQGEEGAQSERDEYIKPRNEKEEEIVSDVEAKLSEDIKAAEEEVRQAKGALAKAQNKESERATDMFANDKAFESEDQIFSSEEMGLDTSVEGVEKRTKAERDAVADAEQKLEKLKSQEEHDSRVRGALDNERRQTSFDDSAMQPQEEKAEQQPWEKMGMLYEPTKDGKKALVGKEFENRSGRHTVKITDYDEATDTVTWTDNGTERKGNPDFLRKDAWAEKGKVKVEKNENGETEYTTKQGNQAYVVTDYNKNNLIVLDRNLILTGEETTEGAGELQEELSKIGEWKEGIHRPGWNENQSGWIVPKDKADELDRILREHLDKLPKKGEERYNPNPMEAIEQSAEAFNAEKKEQDAEIGITHDETPQQMADKEQADAFADTPLTIDEIDGSFVSDVQKTLAKAYLNGNQGVLQKAAYLNTYNDVRTTRERIEGNGQLPERGAQLDSGEDSAERRPGRAGGSDSSVVETEGAGVGERQEQPTQQRVENSEGRLPGISGEGGDSGVSESPSELDGLSSGGVLAGGGVRPGVEGNQLGKSGGSGRSDGNTQKPAAGSDAAIAASKQRLAELRERFKKAGRNGESTISLVGMNNEQIGILMDITTESANLGYQYLVKGIREFDGWRKQMLEDFHDWLQEDMKWSDAEIDEYLNEVWNCEYNIDGVTRTIREWASFIGEEKLREVVREDLGTKFEKQKAAESIEVKTGDIDNIRETLPYLLPEQHEDVLRSETQFFDETHQDREHGNGKGYMFTNGTGTGKTYTGLGIAKRFVKQGKGRVLILTPSQEKVSDWKKDGLNLGLNIEDLETAAKAAGTSATKAKGKGVVVTTYANARQNLALLEDCFDLVIYDESHKITEGKEAAEGEMFKFHQMLTNKDVEKSIDRQTYYLPLWVEQRNLRKEYVENEAKIKYLDDKAFLSQEEEALKDRLNRRQMEVQQRLAEIPAEQQPIRESKRAQAEIDSKVTKTVFLSATPFNTRENLKYAEGYIFSYPEEDKETIGTYNHRSPEEAFLEQTFPGGYRWRYGRLESHISNQEALGRQEIDFSDYLQNNLQTMSGRMIDSEWDYSRDFPVLTLDHAGRFNQAMSEVYRNKKYQPLAETFRKAFDYNYSTALFEAMKTSLVIDRIKEHLKRGQKVVVFHRRRTSGDLEPPFERALTMARIEAEAMQDQHKKSELLSAIHAFETDFKDMLQWEQTLDYTLPRDQIAKVFGEKNIGFFSGAENKKTKHTSVEDFMKDNGGKDIIVIQEASGKEGISLHDQTGEHQRVEINLALPQSPIAFIQIEGRIYRIGQKSNAVFEYPLLGLDLETSLFAQKFNSALGTTENLALGSKARNLRQSIANAVLENSGEIDYERQGFGGKDMDGQVASRGVKDGFDVAISDYYGNQKMKRGRDNREGVDYFPTPEPIGWKMVEWAQLLDEESVLEPSAGHGAIARYVPETNPLTAVEPSAALFSRLQMRAGGPGRKFEEKTFEDYPLQNKHDAILMNPPYGVGGKTAMEHVGKAFKHLNEGGRLIAIIPDGPATEKRVDAWLASTGYDGVNGSAVVVGELKLPDVAFGRAGTSVRTRILVIDKVSREEMRRKAPQKVTFDISNAKTVEDMFEQLRTVRMPERTIDQVAINTKKALKTKKALESNPFTSDFNIYGDLLVVRSRSRYDVAEIRLDLNNPSMQSVLIWYKNLKQTMENPEELEYGKYTNKTYGRGKDKIPAIDAIKDYCQQAIKTLENVMGVTADQMDKMVRERDEETRRRIQEREAEAERIRQEKRERINAIAETAVRENPNNSSLTKDGIKMNIVAAHSNDFRLSERSKNILRNAGIDWQTGEKLDLNEPVNARTSTVVEQIRDIAQRGAQPKSDYQYKLDKNTRTGEDMHLVNMNARLSDADYKAVERKAKAQDGYWNRFKKAWHFKTEEDARKFLESVNASEGNDGTTTRFRLREKEEPKKTQKVYKLMRLGDDKKLYPLFIDAAEPTELGRWYDADSPDMSMLKEMPEGTFLVDYANGTYKTLEEVVAESQQQTGRVGKNPTAAMINDATKNGQRWVRITDTGRSQRRYGGDTRKYMNIGINGSGQVGEFAMRPGWHAGSLPSMRQIGKGRDRNLRDDRFVWVEGEVPADKDYQAEANMNPDKDIPTHIPEDGYYLKATNANKAASQADKIGWYVAGAFKPNRIMGDAEARKVIDDWNEEHPDQKVDYDFERESGRQFNAETMELEEPAITRFNARKKAPETVVPGGGTPFKATVVSSADGAKVINNLENLVKKTENLTLGQKTSFISDVAKAIGAVRKGSKSQYAKFETKDGTEVLVRLSDHNATVSGFDHNGESNGISIVVSRKANQGITNDGNAHLVEYFYSDKELKKADGNPYSEIVKSLNQSLRSGEYKDNTGLAKREEVNGTNEEIESRLRSREGEVFENRNFERNRKAGEELAKSLHTDFEALYEIGQIKNKEVLNAINNGEEVPGWVEFDKNGKAKIYMFLPHVKDVFDAEKTIAHEVIGHKGLRDLLGEKGYKSYMRSLLLDLKNEDLRKYWNEKLSMNGFDTYRTIDEFLAEAAEKGYGDLSMWQKVRDVMTDALRKVGFRMSPSISDVKYMVWLSKQNLKKGNVMDDIKREALLWKLGRERYEAKVRNGEFTFSQEKSDSPTANVPYFPGEGKTLFRHTPSAKSAKQIYERSLNRLGYVWKEAHIDQMQAAVELMRAISGVKKVEDIPSAENFVLMENQISSKEEQMDYLFNRDYMQPLDKAVSVILPDLDSNIDRAMRKLQLYMIKKHGLERNRYIPVRDYLNSLRKSDKAKADAIEQDYWQMIEDNRNDLRDGNITLMEYFGEIDNWLLRNLADYEIGGKDYSGLSSLAPGAKKGSYDDAEILVDVECVEDMLGEDRINDLWEKTKAVSQYGLDMEYEGGLDSKDKHDKVSQMFEWYIPLRGHDETTAEEVYDYLEERKSGNYAGPVLMNAKGRESLSGVDVFAQLGAMNSYAIHRSLQNQMKQSFARFVRNNYQKDGDNRLVTELKSLWGEKVGTDAFGNDVWEEKFPDIPENASADDVAQIVKNFEDDMQQKEAAGLAKKIRQNSSIPFRPVKRENKAQHIVEVWINGEKKVFVVNGNPRAAQAINGQLKAERGSNILWMSSLSHFMAKLNTSYSPDFIMRNTERDFFYAATSVAVKENTRYWGNWMKNYGVAIGRVGAGVPAAHTNLFKRYRDGKLNMSNETDRYFKEFMENGGETGWVESKNIDKWKEIIREGVKPQSKLSEYGTKVLTAIPDIVEAMNERAENLARFATYMTSRQMGRSVVRSVSDAKEVSVNFNRKGSGKKAAGLGKNKDWFEKFNAGFAGWSAQNLQDYIMFYNAGVQGMTNMVKNVSNHPIKGTLAFATFAAAAMLMPQINQYLFEEDDDKTGKEPENPYAELPEYVRRNNLCIYSNKGSFITIALPIELRAMYGIGDMAASFINHPELQSGRNAGVDILTQLMQVTPLDFMGEGAGPLWTIVPSGTKPVLEASFNVNWLGQPIEREETSWNKNKPTWTRAFRNVGDLYVGASKKLNAATNPYGNENIKGKADGWLTDPSIIQHLVEGYLGGAGATANRLAQLVKRANEMSGGDLITSNWMPIVRTQHYTPNERTRYARTRNKWFHYRDEAKATEETMKVLKKEGEKDPMAKMKLISEEEGRKGQRAEIMKKAEKDYNKIQKRLNNTDDLQQKDIYQLQLDSLMENTVKALDNISKER